MSDTDSLKQSDTVAVLHNPKSGARHAIELIDELLAELRSRGWNVESFHDLNTFEQRVNLLFSEGKLRAVVAAGGDGTAAAVATRVNQSVPLRVFPLGTENLLAKNFQFDANPVTTANAIERMKTHQIDAATANGKLFLIMAGIGFDADVVRRLHTNRTGHIRRWHYWWYIVASVFSYRFPKLRVIPIADVTPEEKIFDSNSLSNAEVAWLFVQNLPCYADNLAIAKHAIDDDGLLNVSSFRLGGLVSGLKYFYALRRGQHSLLEDFQSICISDFRIEEIDPKGSENKTNSASYQIDGDWGGNLPVEIRVLPKRVRIIL
ncbi:MAG: diacylglycerol kinase family protein [Planctomycetota bacterium]|nr:diacylglycerol kinase family protein [Planctomycetota bacterium]